MTDYLTMNELAQELGLYEFEIRTTTPAGNDATFAVGDVLTGGTSSETMIVTQVISATRYMVDTVSGVHTLYETLSDGGAPADTAKLILSDYVAINNFLNDAQGLLERETGIKFANTTTSHTYKWTTKKGKNIYTFPDHTLPIVAISSITINGDTYTGDEGIDEEYTVDYTAGLIDFHDGSMSQDSPKRGNLVITYTYGFGAGHTASDIDLSVVDLVVDITSAIYDRWYQITTAPGASGISPGNFNISFKDDELFTEDIKRRIQMEKRWLGF